MDTIKSKKEFLTDLLKEEDLKENPIAWAFAHKPNTDISKKQDFFANVKASYLLFENERKEELIDFEKSQNSKIVEEWLGADLRIKEIEFKSVKAYPDTENPFKINFTKDNDPKSFIILGSNGSGKSSIFEILEFAYCNSIGEAHLRSFIKKGRTYREYLEHHNNGEGNIYGIIDTVDKRFDLKLDDNIPGAVRVAINPETHFISDYDLYKKGQLDYLSDEDESFHEIIASSLGFHELLEFDKNLKLFIGYKRQIEKKNVDRTRERIDELEKRIKSHKTQIEEKKEAISEFESNSLEKDIDEKRSQSLEFIVNTKLKTISPFEFNYKKFSQIKTEFVNNFELFISSPSRMQISQELAFLNTGLEKIKEINECPFCHKSSLSASEIIEKVSRRISELKKKDKLEEELKDSYDEILKILDESLNKIRSIKKDAESMIESVYSFHELSDLRIELSILTESISRSFSDELFDKTDRAIEDRSYIINSYRRLVDLLTSDINYGIKIDELSIHIKPLIEEINVLIENLKNSVHVSKGDDSKILLEKDIKDLNVQLKNDEEAIEREKINLNEYVREKELYDSIRDYTEQYQKVVSKKINEKVNEFFGLIKNVVEDILDIYFKKQQRDVDLFIEKIDGERDLETNEVLTQIITACVKQRGSEDRIPVNKYLNTFHYRLFNTMVCLSIAIASRWKTNITIPVIMDDIFYASDFENRNSVEILLKTLFEGFHKYSKDDMKFQLIFFTHDEVIFESANRVIEQLEYLTEDELVFAKLIPPQLAKLEDDSKNIVYRFPKSIRREILKRELESYG